MVSCSLVALVSLYLPSHPLCGGPRWASLQGLGSTVPHSPNTGTCLLSPLGVGGGRTPKRRSLPPQEERPTRPRGLTLRGVWTPVQAAELGVGRPLPSTPCAGLFSESSRSPPGSRAVCVPGELVLRFFSSGPALARPLCTPVCFCSPHAHTNTHTFTRTSSSALACPGDTRLSQAVPAQARPLSAPPQPFPRLQKLPRTARPPGASTPGPRTSPSLEDPQISPLSVKFKQLLILWGSQGWDPKRDMSPRAGKKPWGRSSMDSEGCMQHPNTKARRAKDVGEPETLSQKLGHPGLHAG